jgi:SRSO17 transposase
MLKMLMTHPHWFPGILAESGITPGIIEGMNARLIDHIAPYTRFLKRSESRENMLAMTKGLLSDLERKSIEPIALTYMGESGVRPMQYLMSDSVWDEGGMITKYREDLSSYISDDDGMLAIDGTDFPKKGNESVGVARQYCGRLGKLENCQASVMASYTSSKGYGLLDRELYLPKKWFSDEYKEKRKKCRIPEDREFKTKNELAEELIKRLVDEGSFKIKYVGFDCSFGGDKDLLDHLPVSVCYFADVKENTRVFEVGATDSVNVSYFAEETEKYPWNEVALGEGSKGPIFTLDKIIRVVEIREKQPKNEIWLYIRKLESGEVKYSICNILDGSAETLRKLALMRYPIEQCFNECKEYLGMDHYESRSWNSWYRHTLLTFIAHLFLIKLRLSFSVRPPDNTPPRLTQPVGIPEYINNYYSPNDSLIFADPCEPVYILTIGMIRDIVSSSLTKVGSVLSVVNYQLKNYSDSYISSHNKKVKALLSS